MKACLWKFVTVYLTILLCFGRSTSLKSYDEKDLASYRERVVKMFHHAYDGYLKYAYPYDELRPLTCDGHDTWGSFSLTLIDALDTLAVMGNYSEFQRVAELLMNKINFDIDINASVFETNIRVIGGLLSAHLFSKRAGLTLEPGWPCSGPLLRQAENVARRLLPAFNTSTGMPYGTVNLKHGVPKGETSITCTAGVGTYIVEFGALSRLTGDPVFEETAMRALRALWKSRSAIGLVGNHIDVQSNKWTATEGGIGGGVDSYFEYLVKGAVMFQNSELLKMYREFESVLETYVKRDDWYMWANMKKGGITLPVFQSLDAFWPGMQSLVGDIEKAVKTIHNFHQVWRQFGFTPEIYNIPKGEAHQGREGYPLRPELVESAMYLYRATGDPYMLEIGIDVLEAIEHSTRTMCGYATVKDVTSHSLENRMESFFLAETTKYLYLLFTPDHFIHNTGGRGDVVLTPNGECILDAGGYVFNTEAHPIDMAAMYCCSAQKKEDDRILQDLHDNLDLLTLLDIVDPSTDLFAGGKLEKRRKKISLQPSKPKSIPQPPNAAQVNKGEITDDTEADDIVQDIALEEGTDDSDDSAGHYISLEDGVAVTESDSIDVDESVDTVVVLTTKNIKSPDDNTMSVTPDENKKSDNTVSDENEKLELAGVKKAPNDAKTEKLMKEVGSKLNLDLKQLSALVESLRKEKPSGTEKKVDSTEKDKTDATSQTSSGSELTGKGTDDITKSQEKTTTTQTVTQEGEWVHIKSGDAESSEQQQQVQDEDKTEKLTTVNSQVEALASMIKKVLNSNSDHVFSGNSGFSFGRKTQLKPKVEAKVEAESDETDEIFGDDQPKELVCLALPYHVRLSVMGEMFEE